LFTEEWEKIEFLANVLYLLDRRVTSRSKNLLLWRNTMSLALMSFSLESPHKNATLYF
jgi:hypothetical protein